MDILNWVKQNTAKVVAAVSVTVVLLFIGIGTIYYNMKYRPNNHNEGLYGVVRVAIDSQDPTKPWSTHQHQVIVQALQEAQKLGPTFVEANGSNADVTIYLSTLNCENDGAGRFLLHTRIIDLDPGCVHSGDSALTNMVVHELGHFIGMHHICMPDQQIPFIESDLNTCSTVGTGPAIMNTGVERDSAIESLNSSFDTAGTPILPQFTVMPLDVDEFKRAWAHRHL